MPDNGWLNTIVTSLATQSATWFVGLVIAILGLFSSRITESIKFALNRADLRTAKYEELATEVSQYIFAAELNTEFIENDWTTAEMMSKLLTDYNESITVLRKKEFVYLSWIQKYWGQNATAQFEEFMKSVMAFDVAIHSLNDDFEAVNILKTKEKIDRKRAEEALRLMRPAIANMRNHGRKMLTALV